MLCLDRCAFFFSTSLVPSFSNVFHFISRFQRSKRNVGFSFRERKKSIFFFLALCLFVSGWKMSKSNLSPLVEQIFFIHALKSYFYGVICYTITLFFFSFRFSGKVKRCDSFSKEPHTSFVEGLDDFLLAQVVRQDLLHLFWTICKQGNLAILRCDKQEALENRFLFLHSISLLAFDINTICRGKRNHLLLKVTSFEFLK